MAELTGPQVEASLSAVAKEIAEERSKRMLWMAQLPLTGAIFEAACKTVGVVKDAAFPDHVVTLWPKTGEVSGVQWHALRRECARRCGVSEEALLDREGARLRQSPEYVRWLRERRAWQEREGTWPDPEEHPDRPAHEQRRVAEALARLEEKSPGAVGG